MKITPNVTKVIEVLFSRNEGSTLRTETLKLLFSTEDEAAKLKSWNKLILQCSDYSFRDIADAFAASVCMFPDQTDFFVNYAVSLCTPGRKSFCQGFVAGYLRGLCLMIETNVEAGLVSDHIKTCSSLFMSASIGHGPKFTDEDKLFLAELNDQVSLTINVLSYSQCFLLLNSISRLQMGTLLVERLIQEFHYKFFGKLSLQSQNKALTEMYRNLT